MNELATRTTNKHLIATVLLVTVVCTILVGLAEVGVRVRHYLKFGDRWGIEDSYRTDEDSNLRVLIPNSEFGSIKINSLGFRSPEIEVPKPPGVIRVAFLGASTTYCAEVSSNKLTWPELTISTIRAALPDHEIDYVNAGVPGYGLSTSLRNLRFRVAPLEPDVIVIYHATNDLSSNSFDLAVQQGIASERTEKSMMWPSRYSLLWYLVEKNLLILSQQRRESSNLPKLDYEPESLSRPFRQDLAALVEASKAVADRVVLITFSTRLRESQDPDVRRQSAVTSLYYMPYMSVDGLLQGFSAYNDVIRDIATTEDTALIEAAESIPGDARHFFDSVHFTDEGSRQMARIVTAPLTQIIAELGQQ